jgi:hypothetical protein
MAKSLLLNILVETLGNYVEGLSKDNLKVAVWSGTIDFKNLQLKSSALDALNLPIKVERGSLKKLHLKVPWASLESKPVIVEIDGIYLQAGPLDISNLTPEEARRSIAAAQSIKLKEVENAIMAMAKKKEAIQDTAMKASYIQQLTAKIIDNLEVSITNMHIRYEDSMSIPGRVLSCGMTIAELSLTTTDESWTAKFVSRSHHKRKETAIHKLGKMENFGVYWNTSSQSLLEMGHKEWEQNMLARIFRSIEGTPCSFHTLHLFFAVELTEYLMWWLSDRSKLSVVAVLPRPRFLPGPDDERDGRADVVPPRPAQQLHHEGGPPRPLYRQQPQAGCAHGEHDDSLPDRFRSVPSAAVGHARVSRHGQASVAHYAPSRRETQARCVCEEVVALRLSPADRQAPEWRREQG